MTEPILLRGAMSFLILCNNKHGPPFCRAMLSVLDETGHLSDSDNEKWGKINYSNGIDERPEDERKVVQYSVTRFCRYCTLVSTALFELGSGSP